MPIYKLLGLVFMFSIAHAESKQFTDFLLIRHGETDWNLKNLIQGHADIPLNDKGLNQAERLGSKILERYPDIAKTVYSSDLSRAVVTAQKTVETFKAAGIEITNLHQSASLREYNFGDTEGWPVVKRNELYQDEDRKLYEKYPDRKLRWDHTVYPGAETFNDLVKRAKDALAGIAKAHIGEKVAVFAHGRLINCLIADSENSQTDLSGLPNCAVVHFRYFHDDSASQVKFIKIEDLLNGA